MAVMVVECGQSRPYVLSRLYILTIGAKYNFVAFEVPSFNLYNYVYVLHQSCIYAPICKSPNFNRADQGGGAIFATANVFVHSDVSLLANKAKRHESRTC